jgi:hypothetical protein
LGVAVGVGVSTAVLVGSGVLVATAVGVEVLVASGVLVGSGVGVFVGGSGVGVFVAAAAALTENVAAPLFHASRDPQPGVNTPTLTVYVPAAAVDEGVQELVYVCVRPALKA